jgi:GT2 family glycosyltransferase
VLVVHDGARWLPDCLAALAAQNRPPQRVVAVDTGSVDGSTQLLEDALGDAAVVRLPRDTGLGAAVQAGLDAFAGAPAPPGTRSDVTEWVWLLHDDCAPEPDALRELLVAAEETPSVAAFGPKVLDWDGRHLLEMGLSIDGSGDRQTGLEELELDQGQHDDVGDVLAVGTAGLFVRRRAWDVLGGLDRGLALFGEDIDFGWRLNEAGERVRVAAAARVRHVGALLSGERRPAAVSGRPGAVARRHGMQVVLANTTGWMVPLLLLRYAVERLLRGLLLLLLARRPGAALDEVLALGGVLRRPGALRTARQSRRGRLVSHGDLRGLLAPPGLRWRRFGDTVAETFAGRAAADERRRRRAPIETGPVSEDAESLHLDTGVLLHVLRRPAIALTLILTAITLVACRDVLGTTLHGGRLLPAPEGAADLWSIYTASWHPVDLGSTTPAPPSLALLAVLSTLLLGKVWLAVVVLVIGAVPLAGLSAYAAAGAVTRSTRVRCWAAVTYALLPALTGAIAGGRLDVIVAVICLPLLLRAVAAAVRADRTAWYRWAGAGLFLGVVAAFAPLVWVLVAAALLAGVALTAGRGVRVDATAVVLVVAFLVLLPWSLDVALHPWLLVAGMGLPETLATARPLQPADLLLLHPGGAGQPWPWLLVPFVLAGVAGVLRRQRAAAARVGVVVLLVGLGAAVVVTRLSGPVDANPAIRYWAGVPLAFAGAGVLAAGVVAADRARIVLRRYSFGWRQPLAAVLAGCALVATAGLAASWLVRGADEPLTDRDADLLPIFAAAELGRATSPRVLALRTDDGLIRFALVANPDGARLGDADVRHRGGLGPAGDRLTDAVRAAAAAQSSAVPVLVEYGVSMLLVPRGTDPLVGLAELDGLSRVPTDDAIVWRTNILTGSLVVLDPPVAEAAAGGEALPDDAEPTALPADPGAADTKLPDGEPGRLLVLAQPADSAWRATLDGAALPAARAYGWAQAWRLPADGGRLEVARTGGHRGLWLIGQLVLVSAAVLCSLPPRRTSGRSGRHAGRPASGGSGVAR